MSASFLTMYLDAAWVGMMVNALAERRFDAMDMLSFIGIGCWFSHMWHPWAL
jgi:hypothetical protein